VCPIGFVCDHVEVLYDLDHVVAQMCRTIGLPMVRAASVNDDPRYVDMMAAAGCGGHAIVGSNSRWARHNTPATL
jgi:ferrochelatase